MSTSVVFLYSEMAGYFQSSLKALAPQVDRIFVYHWPVNPEAPFKFEKIEGVEFIDRSTLTNSELKSEVHAHNPKALVCSGWMDQGYTAVVKSFKKKIPTLLIIDNHWTASIKQKILCALSPLKIRDRFSHAWVAGDPQSEYALKLGFAGNKIIKGFYSADVALFNEVYKKRQVALKKGFPKIFIYVGRYVEHKGIYEMWNAFLAANEQLGGEWKLWCFGTGAEYDQRIEHGSITHFGFVQPIEMAELMVQAGVFILPSKFEPWGVVVHEFAAAGYPMILSHQVGAWTTFLKKGKNGYVFETETAGSIQQAMETIMRESEDTLLNGVEHSHKLGQLITPERWATNLLELL